MAGGGSFNDDSFDDDAFDEESFDGGESLSGAFDSGSFDSGSFDGDSFDLTGGASPGPSVVAAGTVVGANEATIRAGATTLILTLTNAEWVTTGATFNAQRQNIIDGLDSDKAEAGGWNAQIRDNLGVTDVVRTSDTVVTISIDSNTSYDITEDETVTAIVPASAISTDDPLTANVFYLIAETADEEQPSGGYGAANAYAAYEQRKRRREEEQKRVLEEIKDIKDDVDREIAEHLQTDAEREAAEAELKQLVLDIQPDMADMNARVARAYIKASNRGTFSSLLTLERELQKSLEEEEFLFIAMML